MSSTGSNIKSTSIRVDTFNDKVEGPGIYGEGEVVSWRYHSIHTKTEIVRKIAVVVDVSFARERTFDSAGLETSPTAYQTKMLKRGYLLSSYKREKETDPKMVSLDQLVSMFGQGSGDALPKGYSDPASHVKSLYPHVTQPRFEFWGEVNQLKKIGLEAGLAVRFRTSGNGIFLAGMTRADKGDFNTYTGGESDVLNDWQKNLNKFNDPTDSDENKSSSLSGCDSDEW
eukprot:CAMPEP_0201552466 /NCGR_PEP_ID=MMETSP0173_2-20130828/16735_1 /ASSEMBLY_ACC=CAM_ASM_000268 /TAXON_ID=218659 /ORGANISM="Vexillifera sp., Strain DIVA3 564/2" /LENGTH=227 /DNA_ID=CAMNT_0047962963 /DNA_START=1 /DNA_END=681 /DNA_ORIENTATION=+